MVGGVASRSARSHAITGTKSLDLRFPGQLFDPETGFHQNCWRDYDPTLGRYLQSDPIGLAGGLNTYGYAYQNPVGLIDPMGENPILAGIVACARIPACGNAVAALLLATGAAIQQSLLPVPELCPLPNPAEPFLNESAEDRNPAQDKKLTAGEIRALKGASIDPEDLNGGRRTGSQDLYKDKKGRIYVKPKGGKGTGEPTGLNINDFL